MAKKELSQEMIDNIKNYGDELITIDNWVAQVRQNIGMWIGSRGFKGHLNMIREIIQNALDEIMKDSSPCDTVIISYDENSKTIIVEDNGRGIPFGSIIRAFTDMNTSSNYNKKKGEYSSGLHGCGAKVTNALSEFFYVDSYVLGEGRRVEFNNGEPWKQGEKKIQNKTNKQGTIVVFKPAEEALEFQKSGDGYVTVDNVLNLVKLILPLNKIGAKIIFNGIRANGEKVSETLVNEDGIMTYFYQNCANPLITPVFITADTGIMKVDLAFTYDMDNTTSGERIISFCNTCPTSQGDHINGFMKGICKFFTNYMNKVYLSSNPRNKTTVTNADIKTGLIAVISGFHLEPVFNGQAKEILEVREMDKFVNDTIYNGLSEWIKANPNDLNRLCKYFKDIADARMKADTEKIKISKNFKASVFGQGLPAKYVKPSLKHDLELWICEGDSAAGVMRNSRDTKHQGYFPIRGKIPNAFNTAPAKFLSNEEISGIITLIGTGYGKNFDISKVKFIKIVLATDADADGDHISSLFIRFFMMYMPGLIEAGYVYKAVPPLYGMQVGKKYKYFKYKVDYIKYVQGIFSKTNKVEYINGKVLSKDELSHLLYDNNDYTYEVNRIANRLCIDPLILESVITLRDKSLKEIEKNLKKLFRFVKSGTKKGTPVLEVTYNGKVHTVFMNDSLIEDSKNIISMMNKNASLVYKLNGEVVSLYSLMSTFDASKPSKIERYKGLGEMDGPRFFESTLDPENRTLLQYTIEDWKKEYEQIKYYESNKYELIAHAKLSRFDIIN